MMDEELSKVLGPSKHNLLYGRKVMPEVIYSGTPEKIYSIYKIINSTNGKIYVGFTSKNPISRWKRHIRHSKTSTRPLYASIRKHGIEQFNFMIIYQSWDPDHTLNVMESYFIKKYNTIDSRFGYNLTKGGECLQWTDKMREKARTRKHSEETKRKIKESNIGLRRSEETRSKLQGPGNGMYGKKHSKEAKMKMSLTRMGLKRSESHCKNIAKSLAGKKKSIEHVINLSHLWEVTFPDGTKESIRNMAEFCRNNQLCMSGMSNVAAGNRKTHKGFKCLRLD